jgi:host factor-I protein
LDTSLPGVRLIQQWIRQRRQLQVHLASGSKLVGRLLWQDPEFYALETGGKDGPQLLNRARVESMLPLDQASPAPATIPSLRLPLPPI